MQKFNYQTCLRLSTTIKEEIDSICDQHQIRPSDFMRYAIKEKILSHSKDTDNRLDHLRYA